MEAISGPIYLLQNGEIQVTADGSMNPRNSVGIRADGSVVFFMAEGRLAPRSIGMDCYEVAAILKDAGCVTALYLDGGGSATFAAREEGGELKMLSKPSDGHERTISSGMLCISTESQDGVFDHAVISPREELYTPGSAVQFSAVGVDRQRRRCGAARWPGVETGGDFRDIGYDRPGHRPVHGPMLTASVLSPWLCARATPWSARPPWSW